jgi:squalene-associated FAD-dependent desaturase
MNRPAPIHIVGGGWAGIAAAVELARQNVPAVLIEASRQLGGRARCVPFAGQHVDNGQHLMIGAYRETIDLLAQLHAPNPSPILRQPLRLTLLNAEYGFQLRAPPLPAPLHLVGGLLTARGLTFAQRLRALQFCLALARSGFALAEDISVEELLRRHGQGGRLTECLWEPLCIATLNTPIADASAQVFLVVLQDSFTRTRADSDLVFSGTDLGQLVADRVVDFVESRGGHVLLGERVTRVRAEDQAVTALETSVQHRRATRVILATPAFATRRILQTETALQPLTEALGSIDYEPICTVYLNYGSGVSLGQTLIGMTGGHTQWLIDRAHCGQPGIMAAVISARGAHMELDNERLAARVAEEIAAFFPHWPAPAARFVIREKRATFSCRVGINALRPPETTALRGLWLAGDYTRTGYPATLEGAVRSGIRAARAAIAAAPPQ